MKMRATAAVLIVLLVAAGHAAASVNDMTLAADGSIYRLLSSQAGLVLTISSGVHSIKALQVPGTYGTEQENEQLVLDRVSGSVILVWQQENDGWSQVMLASYHDGVWFGPIPVAGAPGTPAANPAVLVQRATSLADDDTSITTTFVHLAWWNTGASAADSFAAYANVELADDGTVDLDSFDAVPLYGGQGVSVICGAVLQEGALAHPQLFHYGEKGTPHVLFFDPSSCSVHILELDAVLAQEPDATSQRRRHVIVFGVRKDLGLPVETLPLSAQYEVGANLSVIGHWDVDGGIEYLQLGESGWSEPHVLPLDNGITHEQGIELLRKLAQ